MTIHRKFCNQKRGWIPMWMFGRAYTWRSKIPNDFIGLYYFFMKHIFLEKALLSHRVTNLRNNRYSTMITCDISWLEQTFKFLHHVFLKKARKQHTIFKYKSWPYTNSLITYKSGTKLPTTNFSTSEARKRHLFIIQNIFYKSD